MKFLIDKSEFLQSLSATDSIINIKSPLPILLNVYIEALPDGSIILLSYNGEHGVKVETTGVVETPGKLSLLSKKLIAIVRSIPDEKIVVKTGEQSENEVLIHPEGRENPEFVLNGALADTYPVFNEFNWENHIKIAQEILKEAIQLTDFSVSGDLSKTSFSGTYIEENVEGMLTFVTTDGKRMSVLTREYEEKVGDVELDVIVPQRILKTILSALSTGDVLFSRQNNQVFFKIGNIYLFSNLVDGKFPNYKDVIPSEKINVATIESDLFYAAVETVSVMSDPESGKILLELSSGLIKLSTSHPIYGVAHQEIAVEYEGDDITIAINHLHVSALLKVLSGKKIRMIINSQSSALVFNCVGDDNFIYLTMPMKVRD